MRFMHWKRFMSRLAGIIFIYMLVNIFFVAKKEQQCPVVLHVKANVPQKTGTFWKNLNFDDNGIIRNTFVHKFYFDDRIKDNYEVRTFILTSGELSGSWGSYIEMHCVLWFKESPYVLFVVPALFQNVQITHYVVNNTTQITYLVICPLKDFGDMIPRKATLIYNRCADKGLNIDTMVDVELPLPKSDSSVTNEGPVTIGVCMTAQYGKVNDQDAFFFIQWMESLLLFGVNKVFMYNATMKITGQYYKKVLDYYTANGVLSFEQFPTPYDEFSNNHTEFDAVEAIRSLAVNECFYKQMHQFSYILHTDKDELVVPRSNKTYQDFFEYYKSTNNNIDLPSFSVPSTFYYKSAKKVKRGVPKHFPLLRYTFRQPTEPHERDIGHVGYAKSFINPRLCNHVWSHRCIKAWDDDFEFLSPDDILVHHYRDKCSRREHGESMCKVEETLEFEDDFVGENYGQVLTNKSVHVFEAIGYM